MPERCFPLSPLPATLQLQEPDGSWRRTDTTIPAGTPCVQQMMQHHEVAQDTVIGVHAETGQPVISRQMQLMDTFRLRDPGTGALTGWVPEGAFERREVPD